MRLKVEMFVPGVIFQQFDGYCNVLHVFIVLKKREIIYKINTNTLFRIRYVSLFILIFGMQSPQPPFTVWVILDIFYFLSSISTQNKKSTCLGFFYNQGTYEVRCFVLSDPQHNKIVFVITTRCSYCIPSWPMSVLFL